MIKNTNAGKESAIDNINNSLTGFRVSAPVRIKKTCKFYRTIRVM